MAIREVIARISHLKNRYSMNKDYSKTNVSAIIEETDYDEEDDD